MRKVKKETWEHIWSKIYSIEGLTFNQIELRAEKSWDETVVTVYDKRNRLIMYEGDGEKILGRLAELETCLIEMTRLGYRPQYMIEGALHAPISVNKLV